MFRPTHPHDARRHHREPRWGPGEIPFGLGRRFGREGWGHGRMRRGEIRPLVLAALATRPMHGYEVMQELEARSGGRWRPSAGSVYPTLQLLADEGLVTSEEVDGRRVYQLTEAGRTAAAAGPEPRPWRDDRSDGQPDLGPLVRQLTGAVMQVERIGSAGAREETRRILADARRQVYRLLAEDDAPAEAAPAAGASTPDGSGPEAG
jgi:DNA-binding PadR family transcriptional regulator